MTLHVKEKTFMQSTIPLQDAKPKRRKVPSRAVTNGAVTGTGLGAALELALHAFGVPIPPGAGAAVGSLVSMGVAYFTRGGRKNEPQ